MTKEEYAIISRALKNTYTALVERGSTEKALSQIFEAEGQLKKAIFHGSLSVREKRLP
ncbi:MULTISPECIES: hypothetical protein [Aeribacillus]|jgi:hypothetical protein|uniref:Uncharacterized protein n=1 Tax=Aeribacillus composti TaxID=1868734 RepID=A0ABY9W6X2_9BACI|nr:MULTISPECIES: hypothetical protein [Aeribacillus]MDR9792969.1 hypothetical protein [Aeribacillus pallidus]MDR9795520.1 hypothetical protein [Aeribacillus pallidus]MED0649001.1 hypothetical protein [Aeribacillus composti]MED0703736.1 hypothetical protein [Aeribacillus composti]MED0715803.1 hypothetical protein [Aeribacillus composti]